MIFMSLMLCTHWLLVKVCYAGFLVYTHRKIILRSHGLWSTRGVWRCIYLHRPCPLSVFSYLVIIVVVIFLGINLGSGCVPPPQPTTVSRVWLHSHKIRVVQSHIDLCFRTRWSRNNQKIKFDFSDSLLGSLSVSLSWGGGSNFGVFTNNNQQILHIILLKFHSYEQLDCGWMNLKQVHQSKHLSF